MDVSVRLKALHDKHAELEREIEAENAKPYPDDLRIAALKKQKLRMKDEIAATEREHGAAPA